MKNDTPFLIRFIKKCLQYGISYEVMARLHFTDLQVLVVEYDIERVKTQLEQLKHNRNHQNGIEERPGTYGDLIPQRKK